MHAAERMPMQTREARMTLASILFFLTGIPLPIFASYTALYVLENRQLPIVFGIRSFGGGFIEGLGVDSFAALGFLFVFVSALDILVGYRLWKWPKNGATLAAILFPVGMFFWIGFLLPGPLAIAILRMLLIASGWKVLH